MGDEIHFSILRDFLDHAHARRVVLELDRAVMEVLPDFEAVDVWARGSWTPTAVPRKPT
jgi:hypothetical protein